jgi:hypothetical protein
MPDMSWRVIKWARKQRVGSPTAKAVLICQAHHADDNGLCWPSQETIAAEIETSVDSVQRALKKVLVPTFVHRIKRKSSDGRRISDAYRLRFDRAPDEAQPDSCRPAPCGPMDGDARAAKIPVAEPQTGASPDGTVRPKYLEENLQESSCRRISETPGGARLEKKLGKGVYNSWFAKVLFIGVRDQLLTLHAPTAHVAEKIEQWFDPEIVRCFEPEYKQVVRVRVIIRKSATSFEGGTQNSSQPEPGPAP